jgi:hypothetical protein
MNTKKTNRKNKTNLTVKWPSSHFTIDALSKLNPEFVNITLRVRLNNAIEAKQVTSIGTFHVGKGRPKLIFANLPVSEAIIKDARTSGVMLNEAYNSVDVTTVTTPTNNAPTKVVTTTVTPVKTAVKV